MTASSYDKTPLDPYDPDNKDIWLKYEHLGRYLFAADYLRQHAPDGVVADVGCGTGYGIPELGRVARRVIALDGDAAVLDVARQRYAGPEVMFVQADLEEDNLPGKISETLDAIVCFETLEHLTATAPALDQFARTLKPGGLLICSVPNHLYEYRDATGLPKNVYHKQFFSYSSLVKLLKAGGFEVLYRVGQAWPNSLYRREAFLHTVKAIDKKLADYDVLHTPDLLRLLAHILAYPTEEDAEGSYALIVVAQLHGDVGAK